MKRILRNKGDIQAIIYDYIDSFFSHLTKTAISECEHFIEDSVDKFSLKFTP